MFSLGIQRRTVAATNMNQRSSRSHVIFTIHIESAPIGGGAALRCLPLAQPMRTNASPKPEGGRP